MGAMRFCAPGHHRAGARAGAAARTRPPRRGSLAAAPPPPLAEGLELGQHHRRQLHAAQIGTFNRTASSWNSAITARASGTTSARTWSPPVGGTTEGHGLEQHELGRGGEIGCHGEACRGTNSAPWAWSSTMTSFSGLAEGTQ